MKRIHAIRQEGYELLHDGMVELSVVEANGIRIDMPRLAWTKKKLEGKIAKLKQQMREDLTWGIWRKRFGVKTNLTSRDQLSTILFDELGFESSSETAGGKAATDEEALQKIDHSFVTAWLRHAKYEKTLGTFLHGIESEVVGDRLHPSFNLHTARTYRSSSDSPNFHNFPVRDKEQSKIIRSVFIASKGSVIVENDFKGIEVSMSACYHKDPNFISYITTAGKDMHRDMAAQLYCLKPEEVSKETRYGAKNKFVFPQFYGDYYIACARQLWDWIDKGKLTTPDGTSLKLHLVSKGIKGLGVCDPEQKPKKHTFEKHVQDVENDFWNNRFMVYGQWRKDWYKTYLDRGYFDMLTGFRVQGTFNRKQVCNYPVQGSAFHCLLWTLIQVNRMLKRYKMKSKIVGQIHDSLIADVRIDELRDYLSIVEEVTSIALPKHWPWINVPMVIEYEIVPVGGSWFDKKEVKFSLGRFRHPTKDKSTTDAERFLSTLK